MTVMFETALPVIPEAMHQDFMYDSPSPSIKQSPSASSARSTDTPATSAAQSTTSSASGSVPPLSNAKDSRRPRRKSTLTQQQKNQKRQRATQNQLATLEDEFIKNPTPGAAVRERIAIEINMTERSVQIWFQNKRAKIKNAAKRSLENGDDCDNMPESMRAYLARQAMETGKPLVGGFGARNPGMPVMGQDPGVNNKVVIQHFQCQSLTIGSWRRVGQNAMDLIAFFSPDKEIVTYYIHNDSAGYKIEYPFSIIKSVTVDTGDSAGNAQPSPQKLTGGLIIELLRPPFFQMDTAGTGGFQECIDFTEDHQATKVLTHYLAGHPKVLQGQLNKMLNLEGFQNRFNKPMPVFETPVVIAPVSPPHRPSSAMAAPNHNAMAMFQEPVNMHLQPGPRGHKRQRSRSVPVAIDFNMLHSGMQQYNFQQHHSLMNEALFAPLPHGNFGAMNPNLTIDTSAPYMDYRSYPLSATTAPTPSDFASPYLHTSSGMSTENIPSLTYGQPFALPYLSPLPEAASMAPSGTPIDQQNLGSPPIITLQEEELMFAPECAPMEDESLMLSQMYSKQQIGTPFAMTPQIKDADELELLDMVNYAGFDPSQMEATM